MSLELKLAEQIRTLIQTNIRSFVDTLVSKYGLEKKEVLDLWGITRPSPVGITADIEDVSPERLLKCTKPELTALCKAKGVKCSGKKEDLISRLLGKEVVTEKKPRKTAKKKAPRGGDDDEDVPDAPEDDEVVTKPKKAVKAPVLKKLAKRHEETIAIKKNDFGNMEHPETRLVFDPKSKKVIGRQEDDGTVSELTDEDIEDCKKFKFPWENPKSLEKQTLDNVKIEELDDVIIEEDEAHETLEDVEEDEEAEIEEDEEDEEEEDAVIED